jgi:hypothetical protein
VRPCALTSDARFAFRRDFVADLRPGILVDLVVLNDAPALLAAEALRGERLLVRDATAFVRYFVRMLGFVEDERYFARIHAAARRKRLREGSFGRPRSL